MGPRRFEGKVALITGGASGIGAAAAAQMVREGGRVLLADQDEARGAAMARELGDAARFIRLDVREETGWRAAIEAAAALGPLTTLVNCAGVSIPATIEEESLEGFRHTIAINLEGTFLGCKYGVAALTGAKGAAIVNVGSTLGHRAGAIFAAYCASKGGVAMLTKAAALHCAEQGYDIRVNAILPGAVHTNMVESYVARGEAAGATREQVIEGFASVHPMKRLGRAEEAGAAICFLASDEASFTTGALLPVDGGYLA